MLESNTRIYVRDMEQEDNLVPAIVQEVLGEKVMVRFLQPVVFSPGAKSTCMFHDASNAFTSVPCQITQMFSKGQYPTAAMVLTGQARVAESRSSFRVDILDKRVTALVNGEYSGEIINMSCGGVALLLDLEDFKPEQWLDLTIQYTGDEHAGKMQVRSVSREKDGRFRYGLMADPQDADLISQLTRISQEIQNPKAKRSSRIGTNNEAARKVAEKEPADQPSEESQKNPDAGASSQQPSEQGETDATEPEKQLQRPGPTRQHKRTPWPGMAKIYIRENHNLRVLSVETADLSRGGISFICPQYIYEGSDALFEKPVEGGFFRVMIKIRNVFVVESGKHEGQHRVGGQFLGAPMQGGAIPEKYNGADAA